MSGQRARHLRYGSTTLPPIKGISAPLPRLIPPLTPNEETARDLHNLNSPIPISTTSQQTLAHSGGKLYLRGQMHVER